MPFHPRMDDPSNPSPSSNVSSSQISIGKEQCCHDPSMSTNFRSTISASCFLARVKKSAGFIRVLPKSHSFGPDVPGCQGSNHRARMRAGTACQDLHACTAQASLARTVVTSDTFAELMKDFQPESLTDSQVKEVNYLMTETIEIEQEITEKV